jgi:hypothetical protein
MNVNMKSRARGIHTRRQRRGWTASQLGVALMIVALVYSCWFFIVISKLGDNSSASSGSDSDSGSNSFKDHLFQKIKKGKGDIKDEVHDHEKKDAKYGNVNVNVNNPWVDNDTSDGDASTISIRAQLKDFAFDPKTAQKAIQAFPQKIKTLTAYIESPFNNEIPNTRSRGNPKNAKDQGIPPQVTNPLPIRKTSPSELIPFEYKQVDSCHDLQAKLPVDAGLLLKPDGSRMFPNTNSRRYEFDFLDYAKYCPVDADPFLPWIHDVFPSIKGDVVHFVAQNKRRCNTGAKFGKLLERLESQVALMQPVGVKTIGQDDDSANEMVDGLWSPENDEVDFIDGMPRYRLATSPEDADEDGKRYTRFICRFHTMEYDNKTGQKRDLIIGETFSVYPFNYEYVNLRKRKSTMLSTKGKDNGLFWLSNFRFDCPVPDNGNLRESIASGVTVLPDGTPSIYVDVVPIRTNPRFGVEDSYFDLDLVNKEYFENPTGRKPAFGNRTEFGFDGKTVFGDKHVLPRVEASGRWANIPICNAPQRPPTKEELNEAEADTNTNENADMVEERQVQVTKMEDGSTEDGDKPKKPFALVACVWASATFHTRGGDRKVDDTMERTREWIEYNLMMGFDHIYIYDNTRANSNETDLVETLSPFSKAEVTRIEWPSIVCNNNLPAHENTGERSSQYAAESSCRQRYGQFTEWIAAFDTDEYFAPMGKYDNIKDVVKDAAKEGTNVLSFKSTRAYPNNHFMEKHGNGGECGSTEDPMCMIKRDNATFLETYNCDLVPLPKPGWADRAKKQIYRPDYVLSHFVHYSTVTKGMMVTHKEQKKGWNYWYRESKSSERFTNELEEAVMIHTKTTVPGNTKGYDRLCKLGYQPSWKEKCRVGFPFPNNKFVNASTPGGYAYNCYTNERVTETYIPNLRAAMTKRTGRFSSNN